MLISTAHAATPGAGAATGTTTATTATGGMGSLFGGDGATGQAFVLNMMLIVILVCLFYFMMIVPQQKRMRRHRQMLDALRKGDEVITSGGLIGTIDKIKDGDDEVVVDLGNGMKVKALRSTIEVRRKDDSAPK